MCLWVRATKLVAEHALCSIQLSAATAPRGGSGVATPPAACRFSGCMLPECAFILITYTEIIAPAILANVGRNPRCSTRNTVSPGAGRQGVFQVDRVWDTVASFQMSSVCSMDRTSRLLCRNACDEYSKSSS